MANDQRLGVGGLSFLFFLTLNGCSEDASELSSDIMSAFQSSCTSKGMWTDTALSHSQSIVSVFQKLKDSKNEKCKNIGDTLNSMYSLATQLHGVLGDNQLLEYRQLEEELQEMLLTLNITSDPDMQYLIKNKIVETQFAMAQARAMRVIDEGFEGKKLSSRDKFSVSTEALSKDFRDLFRQSNDLTECLETSPVAAAQLAMNVAAIGGSFVTPMIGQASYLVAQFFTIALQALGNLEINELIYNAYKNQMPAAMACGLDALTSYYCQAEDATTLLQYQASQYDPYDPNAAPQPPPVSPMWEGMDLIKYEFPIIAQWLLNVQNGADSSVVEVAEAQGKAFEKYQSLALTNKIMTANFRRAQALIDRSTSADQRMRRIEETVLSMAQELAPRDNPLRGSDGEEGNPFKEYKNSPFYYVCWLLQGPDYACPAVESEALSSLSSYLEANRSRLLAGVTLERIRFVNWPQILERVREKSKAEVNSTVYIDPETLMSEAKEGTSGFSTPEQSFEKVRSFLIRLRERSLGTHESRIKNLDDTIAQINQVLDLINNRQPTKKGRKSTNREDAPLLVYSIFHLELGAEFFTSRLSKFIDWDLQDRFRSGEFSHEIDQIRLEANGEIRRRLTSSGAALSNDSLSDLNWARSITEGNIKLFRKAFKKSLGLAIKDLSKKAAKEDPSQMGRNYESQNVATLCLLVLTSGSVWPENDVPWDLCKDRVLYDVLPDPNRRLQIRLADRKAEIDQLSGDPYAQRKKRICSYYQFKRDGRISLILRRPPRGP